MTRNGPVIDPERPLAEIVEGTPAFAQAFEELGIDYCCGGDASLREACEQKGLEVSDVRDRLAEFGTESGEDTEREWGSPSEIADNVVEEHHDYLREELPELESMVEKVARVHGENHPELHEITDEFDALADEMQEHIEDEEENLFPVIERIENGDELTNEEAETVHDHLDGYVKEHDETAERLERIRQLSDGYEVPDDACMSYRVMLSRLEDLEHDTHMHVHKENNVLFPEVEGILSSA